LVDGEDTWPQSLPPWSLPCPALPCPKDISRKADAPAASSAGGQEGQQPLQAGGADAALSDAEDIEGEASGGDDRMKGCVTTYDVIKAVAHQVRGWWVRFRVRVRGWWVAGPLVCIDVSGLTCGLRIYP
jgi:hypothetical protein